MKEASQFEKKYFFKLGHDWRLPDPHSLFKAKKWVFPDLMTFKEKLNKVKSKLNDYPSEKWHNHTTTMNPAGGIQRQLRQAVNPELLTQAWCKFFETVSTFRLIPTQSIDAKEFQTVHLCEAPGAFVAALNHHLATKHPNMKWDWMATTLNPHYEGNDPAKTIFDDRLIIPTEKHWTYGADHTGDIMLEANMHHILEEAKCRGLSGRGTLMLVTADGSIDCQFNPGEQESLVCTLHLCEATTALLLLDKGGSLLLKAFTVFEAENVCLLYLLACAFKSLVAWKPATSREGNSEMYLVCQGYCGKSDLIPWLEVLKKNYGHSFNNSPLFSLDSIPKTFLDQVVECAETFMNFQIHVIERNIETFENKDKGLKHKGRKPMAYYNNFKIREAVTKEFFHRYNPIPISNDSKLMPVCEESSQIHAIKWLHSLYGSSGQFSFNQKIRHKRQECSNIEIWESLYSAISKADEVLKEPSPCLYKVKHPSLKFTGRLCKLTSLDSDFSLQDITVGFPVKKILISKFCHNWLLCLHEQIQSLWNQLEEVSLRRQQHGHPDLLKNNCEQIHLDQKVGDDVSFHVDIQGERTEVSQSSGASKRNRLDSRLQEQVEQVAQCKLPTISIGPSFVWNEKMRSGSFGSGLKELMSLYNKLEENESLLILKAFPLLTRVEVGIIFLLAQLFHQLWFSWPNEEVGGEAEGCCSILLNGRHSSNENRIKVQNYLEQLASLALDEESKAMQQTLLAIVPIRLLCEGDFYDAIVGINHQVLRKSGEEILAGSLVKIKMQRTNE